MPQNESFWREKYIELRAVAEFAVSPSSLHSISRDAEEDYANRRDGLRRIIGDFPQESKLSTGERISKVQSDLFQIREDLRDTLDDAKDARFVRLAAEIGALAEEFLPEEADGGQ